MKKLMIFFAIIMLAGCTYQQEVVQPTAQKGQAATNSVAIAGFKYNPGTITVKAGETVVWTHKDGAPHTVTATSGPEMFDSGTMNKGQTFSQTFTTPGTYEYKCSIHPSMQGTIIVK